LVVATGCALDPKTVGMGTQASGEEGSESASEASDTDEASEGPSESTTMSGVSVGEDTGCVDDECVWDPCSDQVCGALCDFCPPWDEDCGAPGTITVCTPAGSCEPWPNWNQDPCPDQGLQTGFETGLDEFGGCSDITAYASNADDTIAVHIRSEGLVAMAQSAGEPITVSYAGDDPALEIVVTTGSNLLTASCNDAVIDEPVIEERWVSTAAEGGGAGMVTFEVTSNGEMDATATITLEGVVLRRDGEIFDVPITIGTLVLADVQVGWLPG
jgi:hypothetical protein